MPRAAISLSPSWLPVIERDGSAFTRFAYRRTNQTPTGTRTRYMRNLKPMPSPIEIPAASDATPVANGLTVDARTPTPAPTKIVAAATMRS